MPFPVRRARLVIMVSVLVAPVAAGAQTAIQWARRGMAADTRGHYARAAACYTRALQGRGLSPAERAVIHTKRGTDYFRLRQFARAASDFSLAIKLRPDYAPAHNGRCGANLARRKYRWALADCQRAVRLDPGSPFAFNNRGLAWLKLGRPGRAVADFTRAIRLKPSYATAYRNRAAAYQALGQAAKARADLLRARRLSGRR